MDRSAVAQVAAEFDLGTPTAVVRLVGGGPGVYRVSTRRGEFVVKPVRRAFEVELYATVERTLNARGIRQARLVRTSSGGVVGGSGHSVQEFLPGEILDHPSPAQAARAFAHLAAYDEVLGGVDVPAELDAQDTVWTRVVSPAYLRDHLPALVTKLGAPWLDPGPVDAALELLDAAAPAIAELPRRLVHGDVAPDNVVHDLATDEVVAVIDFTPFHEPSLFGLCTALYWYHVHPEWADVSGVDASLAAWTAHRPLSAAEHALVSPLLVREALRRLATPFAAAEESRTPVPQAATRRRYDALLRVLTYVRPTG